MCTVFCIETNKDVVPFFYLHNPHQRFACAERHAFLRILAVCAPYFTQIEDVTASLPQGDHITGGNSWGLLGVAGLPKSWKRVPKQLYRHAIPGPLLLTPCVLAPLLRWVRRLRR